MTERPIAFALHPVDPLPGDLPESRGEYEYRMLTLPRRISRREAQAVLADLAERDHWEVARVCLHLGGIRRVWVRRRIIRVVRTA